LVIIKCKQIHTFGIIILHQTNKLFYARI